MKYVIKILIALSVAFSGAPVQADDEDNPIVDRCFVKWGADYEMVAYCVNKQIAAARKLKPIYDTGMWDSVTENILWPCIKKWGDDYEMQLYCYERQRAAYETLRR